MRIVIFSMLAIMFLSRAQALRCEKALSDAGRMYQLQTLSEKFTQPEEAELIEMMRMISTIREDYSTGRTTPHWRDIEWVQKFRNDLQKYLTKAARHKKDERLNVLMAELDQAYLDYWPKVSPPPANMKYGPTDYGLRMTLIEELRRLNPLLPQSLRLQLPELPPDQQKVRNNSDAVGVVKELESLVQNLYPTSGYKNENQLQAAIQAKGNPAVKRAAEKLINEEFEFAILRPENARWWVPKVGFHNQHVTGSSGGFNGSLGRNAVEASRLGVSLTEFKDQDNDLKPKYGMLIPQLDSGHKRREAECYGSDIFILDKDKLRDRTTWTAGDSLNPAYKWNQRWMSGGTALPVHWEHLFIPWSQRLLLAPVIQGYEESMLMPQRFGNTFEEMLNLRIGGHAPRLKKAYHQDEYVELQFWGELNLDHVKAFVFLKKPPRGEFLDELLQRGIPIYSSKIGESEYQRWTPSGSDK